MPNTNETRTNWGQIAASTAGSAIPAILGMIFAKSVDARQMRQQEKLQELQIRGEKELTDYSYGKQMEMWENTSYDAQKAQMEKAGINPALMYGMGGGGGQTTGTAGATSVTGGNAPVGGREVQDFMGMGMQMQMLQAQKDLIKAQTDKTKVETGKIGGVNTELGKTQIASLTQGIENQKAVQQLTRAQTIITELDAELKDRTLEDQVEMVNYETKKACQQAQQAVNDTNVSDATIQDKIKIIKGEAIGTFLRNALTTSQTGKTEAETKLTTRTWEQQIQKLLIEQQNANTHTLELELRRMIESGGFNDPSNEAMKAITNAISNIIMFRTATGKK